MQHLSLIHTIKIHKMLNDPRVKERLNKKIDINNQYCVPYLAGTNKDSSVMYIDKHFNPTMDDGTSVLPFLKIHEVVEKALIDFYKLKYAYAHKIATEEELLAVKKAGINVDKYKEFYHNPIVQSEHEHDGKSPPDLEHKQYEDSGDMQKYKRLGI